MNIDKISIGEDPPRDVNVLIEIPQGGVPVKYELDKDSGVLRVDRFLHTPMRYPGNYGFVPHTLSEDGDPIAARGDRDAQLLLDARQELVVLTEQGWQQAVVVELKKHGLGTRRDRHLAQPIPSMVIRRPPPSEAPNGTVGSDNTTSPATLLL